MPLNPSDLSAAVAGQGFAFVPGAALRGLIESFGSLADWDAFAASWNDLKTDAYMTDKARFRERRYAVYAAAQDTIKREPHQPHFQTLDYNPLHGGVERWFEPIADEAGNSQSMQAILKFCCALFGDLYRYKLSSPQPLTSDPHSWHIEVHQFRIKAKAGEHGQPTPEGLHRDGRDYVLVLLIDRMNIASGITSIHDLNKKPLGSFTLTHALDAALVDDSKVYHGVTAVRPHDPAKPAYRDVLVVTFRTS